MFEQNSHRKIEHISLCVLYNYMSAKHKKLSFKTIQAHAYVIFFVLPVFRGLRWQSG